MKKLVKRTQHDNSKFCTLFRQSLHYCQCPELRARWVTRASASSCTSSSDWSRAGSYWTPKSKRTPRPWRADGGKGPPCVRRSVSRWCRRGRAGSVLCPVRVSSMRRVPSSTHPTWAAPKVGAVCVKVWMCWWVLIVWCIVNYKRFWSSFSKI